MTESSADAAPPGFWLWSQPYLLLPLTSLFWAGNSIVGRLVRDDAPPVTLTFVRWALALLVLLPFAWRPLKADRAALMANWKVVLALSAFGIAAYNSLAYTGLHTTTAVNNGLLQAAMAPFVLVIAFVAFRERPRPWVVLGAAISTLGALAVVSQGDARNLLHLKLNPGDAFIIAAVFTYAVYTVWLRRAPKVHPFSLLAATFALGSLILLPFVIAEAASGRTIHPGPLAFGAIAYVVIFPSLLAYLFYNRGVQLVGGARASLFVYLVPVFSAAMAVAFLGEQLNAHHYLGGALIAAGIVVSSWKGRLG